MASDTFKYAIIGGGLAAAAAESIRARDADGSILMICAETHPPYDRPPLSKKLWFGKKTVSEIFVHDRMWYDTNHITIHAGVTARAIDAKAKQVTLEGDETFGFEKLLIATGATPRRLDIPGADIDGVCYYRTLDDYNAQRGLAREGARATVIGGGFIGSELAAALAINKVSVTLVFPGPYICHNVFPEYLARAVQQRFMERGVTVLSGDKPAAIEKNGNIFITQTAAGKRIESEMLIVGVGVRPETALAEGAGIEVADGVMVDEFLRTSSPDVYAAGDNASFKSALLGRRMRVEHWDNALNQGRTAGANMAGDRRPYDYQPYFFSDLFEFGYEAVGEVNSRLETVADWQKENDTGVIYYLQEGKVRGVMACNVWDKMNAARDLIRRGKTMEAGALRSAIA